MTNNVDNCIYRNVSSKEYFKNKRQIDLRISKQIEREVDEEIERVQKNPSQQTESATLLDYG